VLCTRDDCPELVFYHKGRIVRKQLTGRPTADELGQWAVRLERAIQQGGSSTLAALDAQMRAAGYGSGGSSQSHQGLLNQVLSANSASAGRAVAPSRTPPAKQQQQQQYGGAVAQYGGGGQKLMGVSQVYEDLDGARGGAHGVAGVAGWRVARQLTL
jgi:hypothetical protein